VSHDAWVLGPFAAAVIPALVILGEFTYWRLVQTGVEDLHHAWEMRRIRSYYRHLVPAGLGFFADATGPGPTAPQRPFLGVTARDLNVLLTASSVVGAINSMLAAAGVALAAHASLSLSPGAAIGLAVLVAIVLYLAHARLAIHRYNLGLADLRVQAQVN
jgi:hypothetical protein